MEKIETGGPAFPEEQAQVMIPQELRGHPMVNQIKFFANGLTKREYFAAALTGILSSPLATEIDRRCLEAAKAAFEYSDAMLKQSAQTEKDK